MNFIWKNLFLFYFIFFISAKIYFEEKFHGNFFYLKKYFNYLF